MPSFISVLFVACQITVQVCHLNQRGEACHLHQPCHVIACFELSKQETLLKVMESEEFDNAAAKEVMDILMNSPFDLDARRIFTNSLFTRISKPRNNAGVRPQSCFHLHHFLTRPLWNLLTDSKSSDNMKLHPLGQFLSRCGLVALTEPSQLHIAAMLEVAKLGPTTEHQFLMGDAHCALHNIRTINRY